MMQQLTGLDASFLYLETATMPMHISGLGIYDPATAEGGKVRFKQIVENVRQRALRIPAMCSTLQTVPLRWDHPYWKRTGDFDPEFHIRHLALPQPGDWRQLCILVARLHARPLDRRRPLWEMYVIEGLDKVEGYPKGCFAVFTKVHHAAVDGASGNELTAQLHDLSPDWQTGKASAEAQTDRTPSNIELLLRAQLNTLKQPFRFVDVARHSIPGVARLATGITSGRLHRISDLPRTRFNRTVTPHRVFGAEVFDLATIRGIKNAVPPATVNDVALTICGGALHKYLQAKSELPGKSLAAMAPINIRAEDKKGAGGNLVSQMTVNVRSDIDDALQRLRAVNEGTRDAKELTNAIGAKTMTDYTQFVPSTLTASAARLASSLGVANHIKPIYNCVITNVPGPQQPLYFTGAKLLSNLGAGPIMDGTGLFHAITSYCGEFAISFVSCRQMLPDPAFYAQCLRDSFEELKEAAGQEGDASAPKPGRRKAPAQPRAAGKRRAKSGRRAARAPRS